MIVDTLKARITQAVMEKDEVSRDVLRLAFAEVQTQEARNARPLKDEEVVAILRKLVKSNEETLSLGGENAQLRREIVEPVGPPRRDDHRRAGPGQHPGEAVTESRGRAGHDGDAPVEAEESGGVEDVGSIGHGPQRSGPHSPFCSADHKALLVICRTEPVRGRGVGA